jgi:hypothetical protein
LGDEAVSVGPFQSHAAVESLHVAAETIADPRGQPRRIVGLDGQRVAADFAAQFVGRVERHQFALVENRQPVGLVGFFQQVRREDDRHAVVAANRMQVVPQVGASAGVEAGARFVENQHPRFVQQTFGQLDATTQAARERFAKIVAAVSEPQPREHVVGTAAEFFTGQPVEMPLMAEVLGDGQLFVQTRGLKHDADSPPHRMRLMGDAQALHFDLARLQRNERAQQAEEGRLAAPVGTEQAEDFAFGHAERNVIQRRSLAVFVRDAANIDGG